MFSILYASDIHGSDHVFRKLLALGKTTAVDVIVIGGDLMGKRLVPIVELKDGRFRIEGSIVGLSDVRAFQEKCRKIGEYSKVVKRSEYPYLQNRANYEAALLDMAKIRLNEWVNQAEEAFPGGTTPILMMLGNDDPEELADILNRSRTIINPDNRVIEIGGYEFVSLGQSNPTPFKTYRELPEDELQGLLEQMFSRVVSLSKCILNSHVPPFGTLLDEAFSMYTSSWSLDRRHVGSKAVRKAISRYQPLVGLHGHVHESPGVDYIGRTTLFNPGSKYESGQLRAVRVTLEGDKVHSYQFFDE